MRISLGITICSVTLGLIGLLFMAWHKVPRAFIELLLGIIMSGFGLLTHLTVGETPVGYATQFVFAIAMLYSWREAAVHVQSDKLLTRR